MTDSEMIEEIALRIRVEDLENPDVRGHESARAIDPDDCDIELDVPVVRLGADRFRLTEPVSVFFVPVFNLGDVIEARPLNEGEHLYVRTLERAHVWTRVLHLRSLARRVAAASPVGEISEAGRILAEALRQGEGGRILARIAAAGGAWEYCVGNLQIQLPLRDGESEPSGEIQRLLEDLPRALGEEP